MSNEKIFAMPFSKLYGNYVKKVVKKGREQKEVDELIFWLLGYDNKKMNEKFDMDCDLKTFIDDAPIINEKASLIKGKVCGVKVEEVEDYTMRHVHYLDKLVDELAKGKDMDVYFAKL